MKRTDRTPPPLSAATAKRLRALLEKVGQHRASAMLRMPRWTLIRAASGVPVRIATAQAIERALEDIEDERAAS